jgi:hypothetical protein
MEIIKKFNSPYGLFLLGGRMKKNTEKILLKIFNTETCMILNIILLGIAFIIYMCK